MEIKNISLLCKGLWRLDNEEGDWQEIIRAKYLGRDTVASVKGRITDSPCWKAIMKVKDLYMVGRKVVVHSGNIARLWTDPVGDQVPFADQFPQLFAICNKPECVVKDCVEANLVTFFRRRLTYELNELWKKMVSTVKVTCITTYSDRIKLRLLHKPY